MLHKYSHNSNFRPRMILERLGAWRLGPPPAAVGTSAATHSPTIVPWPLVAPHPEGMVSMVPMMPLVMTNNKIAMERKSPFDS